MKLLVTGGAGFIGSNFVRHALRHWPESRVVVLDKLTYSGSWSNLGDIEDGGRLECIPGDICDGCLVESLVDQCDAIVNLAAETHVDRSILDSGDFVRTDVEGTRTLLEAVRKAPKTRYLQVSTDEVYGDVPEGRRASEDDPLRPRSPYAASKAAGDLMVQAYHITYGLDTVITRCSNNFGPYQFPEKLIPLFLTNALQGSPVPVYGDGMQQRDWIYVDDHCSALAIVLEEGQSGGTYNIGSEVERPNMDVVAEILRLAGGSPDLIRHVADRPGHDRRYAMSCARVRSLGWEPGWDFWAALKATADWYRNNEDWWTTRRDADFASYYSRQYGRRLQEAGR